MCSPSILNGYKIQLDVVIFYLLLSPDFITLDITKHAKQVIQILELAASTSEKLTPLKLVDAWMGKGPAKHRKSIQPTILSRPQVEDVIVHLLLQDYLGSAILFHSRISMLVVTFNSCLFI